MEKPVLNFETIDELQTLFKEKNLQVTEHIYNGIKRAVNGNAHTAELFEITLEGDENAYEINLARENWLPALEQARMYYHDFGEYDKAIDTHLLLEKIRERSEDNQTED